MANLTNSAKLIEEMSKKAYKTELPTVNNATVTVAVNGNTGTNSFTTNQASNSTLKITVGKSDVGLGNVDNTSDANKPISTATQAALDLKADKSEISSVYKYKGSKANYDALPSSGNVTGDVWNVEAAHTTAPIFPAGSNLAWDGSAWDVLGGTVDLSNYLAKNNTTAFTPTGDYNPATKKYVDDNKTEYDAGEGIVIGTVHSDMQGPAPDGFHVPLTTEWQSVYNIWTALGGGSDDGSNFGIALKIPLTGYRSYSATVGQQGSTGSYWSSSRNNANYSYRMVFSTTFIEPQNIDRRANGFSIRCFKDTPIIPTSYWTKLYGTSIESGGIFWSSTDGLISLSSDGQTWITIMDKNLGATTVWNSGDTLSEANCGKYYQWGNNYGFARTGSVTTSSTQVDASNYGPGNYYSSSRFITYSGRWDTTDNGNLWGGVSQGTWVGSGNTITNTGVLSVNGQTGDVTISVSEFTAANGGVKRFLLPSQGSNIATIVDWLSSGGGVMFYDTYSELSTVVGEKYYLVINHNEESKIITAVRQNGNTVDTVTINYNSSYSVTSVNTVSKTLQDQLVSGTNIKTINNNSILGTGDLTVSGLPSGGTTGQVVTKTASGAEWANPAGGGEIVYCTQSEYNNLPSSKLTDGKSYFIYQDQ